MSKIKFLLSFAALFISQVALSQQLVIQITKGVDNPIPIAIVPFEWTGFGVLPENITTVVSNDLNNSGEFKPIPEKNMLSTPHQEKDVYYKDWRFLGSDFLLVGKISKSADSALIQVQYELFDVVSQKRMVGEVISGTEKQLRDISHQISDVVYEKILHIRGAFATKILYITSQRAAGGAHYQLNLADADGGRAQVLLDSKEPIMSPAWSPDASQIAYVSFESGRSQIYIQNLSTGAREQLTNFQNSSNSGPAWSPDGTKMAMVLSKDSNPDIYVMDLRSRKLNKITTSYQVDTEPSWMPDGKSLLYTSDKGGPNRPQIYQVSLETGWDERITFDGTFNAKATMLPDGKNIVLIHRGEVSDDFHTSVMNLERGSISALTDSSLDESPTVAPNARMVMYSSKEGDHSVLNAVSINDRIKYKLPVKDGDVREPAWSPFMN